MTIMQSHPVSLVGPVMIVAESAAGQTFEVPSNNVAVFAGPDTVPVTAWKAEIADPSILRFVPGESFETWRANPSLHPLREGTTDVTVSGPDSAQSYTFSVKVCAPIDLGTLTPPGLELTESHWVFPPIIIDAASAQGSTCNLTFGLVAVFVGPQGVSPASWQASIANPAIAEFTPGHVYDTFATNPGFRPLAEGSTEVRMTSTESPESYTFTLIVEERDLAAVASNDDGASAGEQMPGPVWISVAECAGRTYQLPLSGFALLCGYEPVPPASWHAEVADPAVVEFIAANPGFRPLCPGTTAVTLTSADWPRALTFTLEVGEPYYPGAPTVIDATGALASNYQLPTNTVAIFNGPDEVPVTSWQASIADPSVLEFEPGGLHGTWTANPVFHPLRGEASTQVTVSSRESAQNYTFMVTTMTRFGAANGSPDGAARVLPPIMIELGDCFGQTYQVPLGRTVVFNCSSAVPLDWWQAEIEDPSIVIFVPGRSESQATYNPGFRPFRPGVTRVRMTNPFLNGIWDFTIEVPSLIG